MFTCAPRRRTRSPHPCVLRGMSMILVGATALAPAARPGHAIQEDAVADSLIGVWIDSVGGMATYHRFTSASFTVATILHDTLTGRVKRNRPRYVWIKKGPHGEETRVERWEAGGLIQQGFNGRDDAWAALNGRVLPDTAKDVREALYVARDLFYWFGLPFKLRDPGVKLSYLGMIERPGAPFVEGEPAAPRSTSELYHAVGVSFGEGVGEHSDVFTYYFAEGRGFPTEVTYVEEGRTDLNRLLWGTTHRSGEIRYPYVERRDWLTESGKRTKALVIADVVMNPAIPQKRFERP